MDRYRTISQRFIALIIDALVFVPIIALVVVIDQLEYPTIIIYASDILSAILSLAYYILLHWKYGQTVGKMVMKIKVLDILEGPISLKQALLRDIFYLITSPLVPIIFLLFTLSGSMTLVDTIYPIEMVSYVLIYFWLAINVFVCVKHEKDRALHDLIAGTVVVRLDVPETPTDASKLEPPGPEHYQEMRVG